MSKPIVMERGVKYRDADKMALIPVKKRGNRARSPATQAGMDENQASSGLYTYPGHQSRNAQNGLHSVCEEASCLTAECFNHGTATFMILGAIYPPLPVL